MFLRNSKHVRSRISSCNRQCLCLSLFLGKSCSIFQRKFWNWPPTHPPGKTEPGIYFNLTQGQIRGETNAMNPVKFKIYLNYSKIWNVKWQESKIIIIIEEWVKNDTRRKEYNLLLQSQAWEQNRSTNVLLRGNGGALHETCVTFTQKRAV